jgi:two-component system, chemotaxis family, sensor kinase CheA
MTESDFLDIFRDEATERLDHMVATLLALEAGAGAPDAVDSLFRDAHTIKGAAGMLGLEEIQALAHAVEDVLDGIRDKRAVPPELIDPLLRAADSLRRHVADAADELASLPADRSAVVRDLEPDPERRSIRVPAEKLDRLLDLVGETVLHRRRLEHKLASEGLDAVEPLADELDVGERLLDDLQDAAIEMRTLPLSSITGPLVRAVRDLAAARGRDVELVVEGADTELDRVILEGIAEPIVHVLRNSVAHGIEAPHERDLLGKPAGGRIVLKAEQRGRMVAIVVADDGKGLPAELFRQARVAGTSLVDILTAPGFSTAGEVSELSGRGVGLDAVRRAVEAYGGTMSIESELDEGTTTTLLVPLTLALLDVLLVERGGQPFGVPLPVVEEAVAVDRTLSLVGKPRIELRGESLPVVDLADSAVVAPEAARRAPAVIISASGRRVALLCDSLIGEQEVVVKSLGPLLAGLRGYLGAAILGDGRIALLLDPASLGHRSQSLPFAPAQPSQRRQPKVLVVEDSFPVRELERSILEAAGYRVVTASDGREALQRLEEDRDVVLVLTDIEMPELDGLQLVRAIRADERHTRLPVIIVAARGDDEDRRAGLEAGADAYLAKRSFDQQALLDTISQLVAS